MSYKEKADFTSGGWYDRLVYEFVHTDMDTEEFERQLSIVVFGPERAAEQTRAHPQSAREVLRILKSSWG